MMLIDVHAHIDYYRDEDMPAVLNEIRDTPIFTVSAAVDPAAYTRNQMLAKDCPYILPTFGVHPLQAPKYANRLDELCSGIEQTAMISEVGLDHFRAKDPNEYPAQRAVLGFFLAAAREQDKIVTLHTKAAEAEALELLDEHRIRRAIIHWYQGPLDILEELVARGYYFSIGFEVLTIPHVQEIASAVPIKQLLTETDNPAARSRMSTQPMPLLVRQVVEGLAALRETTSAEIESTVEANWLRLIAGDDRFAEVRNLMVSAKSELPPAAGVPGLACDDE
jgi:TatD DNase family protein